MGPWAWVKKDRLYLYDLFYLFCLIALTPTPTAAPIQPIQPEPRSNQSYLEI